MSDSFSNQGSNGNSRKNVSEIIFPGRPLVIKLGKIFNSFLMRYFCLRTQKPLKEASRKLLHNGCLGTEFNLGAPKHNSTTSSFAAEIQTFLSCTDLCHKRHSQETIFRTELWVGQELATICTKWCMTTFMLFPILGYFFVLLEILPLPRIYTTLSKRLRKVLQDYKQGPNYMQMSA